MVNLPEDLKKYERSQKLKPVFVFVLCEITAALFFVLTRNVMYQTEYIAKYNVIGHAFYTVIFTVPLFISGIFSALSDKTFYGTIEKVKISTTVDSMNSFKPSKETRYRKNTIYLYVKEDGGEVGKFRIYSGRAKEGQFLETYNNGDRVFHLYGSKYTVIIPKPSDTMSQCAVCGITTDINEEFCHKCGHTLPHVIFKTGGEDEKQDF